MINHKLKRMKKVLKSLIILSVILFAGCEEDDVAVKYEVTVTVEYPEGYGETHAKGVTVKAKQVFSAAMNSAITDNSGVATFNLEAGEYNFSVVHETEEFAFNGVLDGQSIADKTSLSITFEAVRSEEDLVIKEIYYTGSRTPEGGRYYADQFHEIYNNSDEVIYLDGLGIGLLQQTSSKENIWVDGNGDFLRRLPLQFHVWFIPGNGTDHPLEPRTSIVIAQDGIDHKTDPDGNPDSPVNLGNADWESYCGDINGGKDADAAGVPNLSLMHTNTTSMYDWLHSVFGAAVVIFRLPQGTDPVTWASDPANLSTEPGSTSPREYLMVPKEFVIDAVEVVRAEAEKQYKRLPNELDAGKVWCSDTYVSKSVRRKVKQIIDGKVIYKDTNNSTEDFLGEQDPTPGVHPTVVDN